MSTELKLSYAGAIWNFDTLIILKLNNTFRLLHLKLPEHFNA